jgi:serine/threonine protein kinase
MSRADQGPEDEDLPPGTAVGEYVVGDKIGEGAFGKVYRGRQPLIGKNVAIKLLSRRFSADPEMVSRFVAEARAVNQIAHRNIIDIFSFGNLPDGRLYFVMELLQGRTLDHLLRSRGFYSVAEALPILRGLARALDAAHAHGIAHRDLKPANVFVTTDDEGQPYPKLLDFGIAKLVRPDAATMHKTRTGAPMGTPYYMSPEQCRGDTIDTSTDAYSFGVMTFQLLTGHLPFTGDSYVEILFRHMTVDPPPPSTVSGAVPRELDALILRLMAKSPRDRPQSLVEAVRALEAAAVALGVSVPRSLSEQPAALLGEVFDDGAVSTAFAATAPSDPERRPSLDAAPRRSDGALSRSDPAQRSDGPARARPAALATEGGRSAAMGPNVLSQTLPGGSTDMVAVPRRPWAALAGVAVAAVAALFLVLRDAGTAAPIEDVPAVVAPSTTPPPASSGTPSASAPAVDPGMGDLGKGDPSPPPAGTSTAALVVTTVRLRLEGTPVGAEAVDNEGRVSCKLPCTLELPRSAEPLALTVRAHGFASQTRALVPDQDREVSFMLERQRTPRRPDRPRKPNKDDVEEAF